MNQSRRPILVGIDGQPISKSFAAPADDDAVVSEDGKTVTMKRPRLPEIKKEILDSFMSGQINPNMVQTMIVHENPLILHFVQVITDNIDAVCAKHDAISLNRKQCKDLVMEVASAVYYLLQSQLEYDKAQAVIAAHKASQENSNAVQNQETR